MTNYCIINMNKTWINFNFPSSWDTTIRLNREMAGEELRVQPFSVNACKFLWTELFKHRVSSKAKGIPPTLVQKCRCSTLTWLNVSYGLDFISTKIGLNRDFTDFWRPRNHVWKLGETAPPGELRAHWIRVESSTASSSSPPSLKFGKRQS